MANKVQNIMKKWREKTTFMAIMLQDLIERKYAQGQSQQCLKRTGLKAKTEGWILAAQDQCVSTNTCKNKIMTANYNINCRMCNQHIERVDNIISVCSVIARFEYIYSHERTGTYIYWTMCQYHKIKTDTRWYKATASLRSSGICCPK